MAVHRKHHTFTDKEGDPHSPRLLGFWKVQLWNVYYYIQEARNPQTVAKFAPDLVPDWWERHVFSYGWTGLVLGDRAGTADSRLVAGRRGHARPRRSCSSSSPRRSSTGWGTGWGAQNFENTAYNSRVLAWLTGGESLHNNHHAFPRSPKFSLRRSELDPSWLAIRLLAALRLVAIVSAPMSAARNR